MPESDHEPNVSPGGRASRDPAYRLSKLRKPDEQAESLTGGMVIRALVRAKLLGIRILMLEARVVVRPDDGNWTVLPPLATSSRESREVFPRPATREVVPSISEPVLERAIELVEQGADTLERTRRIH